MVAYAPQYQDLAERRTSSSAGRPGWVLPTNAVSMLKSTGTGTPNESKMHTKTFGTSQARTRGEFLHIVMPMRHNIRLTSD